MARLLSPEKHGDVFTTDVVCLHQVTKHYSDKAGSLPALNAVDLLVARGTFTDVVGKSGSGKTTLINMLTGIDRPTSGEVIVAGTAVHMLTEDQLAIWRGRTVGVIFQFFQLLPTLTVVENVMLAMDFCNTFPRQDREARALALLEQVGIRHQATKMTTQLSGGQQQRAAIARALTNDPPLLIAGRLIGNHDSRTAEAVVDLFANLIAAGRTVIMVTHERDVSRWATHILRLNDGQIDDVSPTHALRETDTAVEVLP